MNLTIFIVAIGCFAAGGVSVLMFQGASLKVAIAAEIAAIKADLEKLRGNVQANSTAQAPQTSPPKA